MSKFKTIFALIAVLVILAAPAYAAGQSSPVPTSLDTREDFRQCDEKVRQIVSDIPQQEFLA